MIQRIQSVYLIAAIILLAILFSGINLFEFQSYTTTYKLNVFGLKEITPLGVKQTNAPFFMIFSLLIVMLLLTLISFKQLKRQFSLVRMTLFFYFVLIIGVIALYAMGGKIFPTKIETTSIGWGVFLLSLGFPLTYLAFKGIQKDKNLIDSLNRLR